MKNNIVLKFILTIFIITIILCYPNIFVCASSINDKIQFKDINVKSNKQIYLGSASIIGNGNNSKLKVDLANDLLIKLNSSSDVVDFYIIYDIKCNGLTDEGVITLTIFLNNENISFNFVQTQTNKDGMLKVENIEIKNRDALTFIINIAYGSVIPLYNDYMSATGFGIVSKPKNIFNKIINFRNIINFKLLQLINQKEYMEFELS